MESACVKYMHRGQLGRVLEMTGMRRAELLCRLKGGLDGPPVASVALLGDEAVGFLLYRVVWDTVVVEELTVADAYRRTGVGRILLNRAKQRLCRDVPRLRIDVPDSLLFVHQWLAREGLGATKVVGDSYRFEYLDENPK